ncbi:probable serine/threonine-protein kinase mps1 isoform X2 [Vigna radiata var. radiata]|uniref:Probable serine/threonine-protein kinase mps1 isoform X2 n=1 Tax=Vigna radiata var. radiata TaxID=3916 RepID=A0A1S3TXB7_VIGRR|nr:probable serine/threonine-protein kinase mps1 isoform X2 [Vigna radiata var. radiata]
MDGKPNPDSSSPDFLRHVQAALKRHRPLGSMQSNSIRPRRTLLPQRKLSNTPSDPTNSQEQASSKVSLNTLVPSQNLHVQKKDQFSVHTNSTAQEMEWVEGNQIEASSSSSLLGGNQKGDVQQAGFDASLRCDSGVSSMLPKRSVVTQDHLQQFSSFLSQPATQSSVLGPSCATTTSVHSTSAPMLNSTTRYSHSHLDGGSNVTAEPFGEVNANPRPVTEGVVKSVNVFQKETNRMLMDRGAEAEVPASDLGIGDAELVSKESNRSREQQGGILKESGNSKYTWDDGKGKEAVDVATTQPQVLPPTFTTTSSDVKLESSKVEKREKIASSKGASAPRKRTYDPDLFFKVNGKLYQRLGKIGSGGSSEVHKVISSDCRIYALKKIKLKGRDYATAFGFCQEIEYLNRLKGKDNIIQLIDYEVTDKALLEEVMKGSLSNRDGRVKDDGCIYMVLEYGEIDLAHMLSQKWKELDGSHRTIDENWLRFYWQQILLAVNTIHEERIVHSDLKPANFLLVKGSLKLIDFGIAKAIMNDTTNIQRDSQVGTLSYMSPEAFMCNETDANGNIIKCGRSSDIWSLGCILYQMVYGRTPFSDYKTFWAKFKVITDPHHEITYEPVSNPWLLDLMMRCLTWDRNQRWRIPQLLEHPFLVPPVPSHPSLPQDNNSCKLLQHISETCTYDPEVSELCSQLQRLLSDSVDKTTHSLNSRDQQIKLLSQMSDMCIQLHERLRNTGNK